MRWLTQKLKNWLPYQAAPRPARRKARRRITRRPELEPLEDRTVPATGSGVISGVAFIDINTNGLVDSGETLLPGANITLTGTTAQGTAVNTTATTDANGAYSFQNVLPGTYALSAGPESELLGGAPAFAPDATGADHVATISVVGGQTVTENFGFLGLAPGSISLREFLSTTTPSDFPFPAAGSGQGQANPRSNSAPVVASAVSSFTTAKNSADKLIDLAAVFTDPDITDTQVRFDTSAGAVNVQLFDTLAPQTVANFLDYINSGAYTNSIFHRLVSGFVLQGGGFTFDSAHPSLNAIPTLPPVQNEFHTSNTLGTLAMAKLGSDPNSATSQFFFNLADNSSNLDNQNGGFTVFGKVMGSSDQQVVDTLAGVQAQDESGGNSSSPFNQIPLSNYSGTKFPTDTTASNYDLVKDVAVVSQSEKLTYSVVSDSNPGLVTASVQNERLTLHYAPNAAGSATITVRATDEFGATVDNTFTVTVANLQPTAKVTLSPSAPKAADTVTATVTASDPNKEPVNLTYVWSVNGSVVQTTSATKSTTDTLDLSKLPNVRKGDKVTVSVTPNDGFVSGAAADASTTVADTAPTVNVSLSPAVAQPTDTLTATASAADVDGDPVSFTYTWTRADGSTFRTQTTTSTTDSVDLSTVTGLKAGDHVTVSVTPNDGTLNGTAATASTLLDNKPVVSKPISDVAVAKNAAPTVLDLAANFSDPDTTNTQVVFNTSAGPINVQLFDAQAPQTVANFLDYVNSGAYNSSIFERLVSGFVLQGGGFTFSASGPSLNPITAGPMIQNEADPVNRSNVIGTIAMAKVPPPAGGPDSATDEFFFNLANNNTGVNNLDTQNGGFTVFGKIMSPTDQQVINTLASAPIKDESQGNPNSPFGSIPLQTIANNDPNFPHDTTASEYDLVNSVQIVKQTEALTYSVVSNSNPGLVTVSVQNEHLTLTYASGQTGTATIVVKATDKAGLSVTTSFNVTVS